MAQLVPSILETSKEGFLDIYHKETMLPNVHRIQVDFGDGIFVPNKILPVTEIDALNPAFHWEAHLMVKEPNDFLDYQICGFKTIIIHHEAFKSAAEVIKAVAAIKSAGMVAALCLKNETPVSVLKDFSSEVNHFQLMGVTPGAQGSAFFENTYTRIAELRKLAPNAIIEVDGGIHLENVKKVADSGANLLILGSAITKAPSMLDAYEKIQNELNKN